MYKASESRLEDPTFREGHSLIYEAQVLVYVRYLDVDKNMKTIAERELLTAKILTQGSPGHVGSLRLNLSSESDLFFSASFDCDEDRFELLKRKQELPGTFQQFAAFIMKLLNNLALAEEKQNYREQYRISAELVIYTDSKSNLTFHKNLQIKNVELLSLDLVSSSHSMVEESIMFRYGTLRENVKRSENRLKQVTQILMEKNPSLAAQLGRVYTKF